MPFSRGVGVGNMLFFVGHAGLDDNNGFSQKKGAHDVDLGKSGILRA